MDTSYGWVMTHTERIVEDVQTPTGQAGVLIECTCTAHKGNCRAVIRKCEVPKGRIHGLVLAAHHPFNLAGAESTKRFGPWAA